MFRTPIDLKYCTIALTDGGAGTNQNTVTIKVGNGDITWSVKRPIEYVRDRGLLDTVRRGDQEPVEMRLNCTFITVTQDVTNGASEAITPADVFQRLGSASNWASSSSDNCEPYAVNVQVTYDPLCPGIKNEVILFPDFRYESLDFDVKAGTLSVSGKCNATAPTVTRVVDPTPETGSSV